MKTPGVSQPLRLTVITVAALPTARGGLVGSSATTSAWSRRLGAG